MSELDHLLSEEERAAMAADTPSDDLPAEVVDDGAAPAAKPAEPAAAAEPAPEAAPEAAPAAEAAEPAIAAPTTEDDGFVPRMVAPVVPEDAEAKLKTLREQFDAGDITIDAYTEQRDAIVSAQRMADFVRQQNDAQGAQRWAWEVDRFLEDNPGYKDDKILFAALDATVKMLGSEDANADKTMRWFLREADRLVMERFGKKAEPAAPGAKVPEPKELKPRAPVTLAAVPTSGTPAPGGGEFDHLSELSGEALEAAVAKMPAAQRERWLAA